MTDKTQNPELLQRLRDYKAACNLTTSELARQLATHVSTVSSYLTEKPKGDVDRLEAIIEDVLKSAKRREQITVHLFANSITKQVNAACETVRKTNDVALIHGPAGIGKSAGAELYQQENPSTILFTVPKWQCDRSGVEARLFDAVEHQGWAGNTRRALYLERKLAGSNRLIIVDNAQRLRLGGLEFLFDFHDATNVPIALVGNPSVLKIIRENDQLYSRIGLVKEIRGFQRDAGASAEKLIAQLAPAASTAINGLGMAVAEESGHLRRLRKVVLLARDVVENGEPDWAKAFHLAQVQQVNQAARGTL